MNQKRTIAFHTLGCKLNFAETSTIGKQLSAAGYNKVDFYENPDVFLINTCSVTENADRECRSIVNRALRVNSDAVIIVTGCFAQLKPEAISNIPGVDLVLGAAEKFNAAHYLENIYAKGEPAVKACEIAGAHPFLSSWSHEERTRVFLKVQDGCDYSCTFCTIPLARGRSRSNTIAGVVREAEEIVASGAKEIILTGINLGDFGLDPETHQRKETFYDLAKVLDKVEGLQRIRISSIEPNLLDERLIDLVAASEKFVPHFHIPLQSGSDTILKKMKRRYLTSLYRNKISYIHSVIPGCAIGVDVITGFPGETDENFNETLEFLQELNVAYLHVFTYSERENTPATQMTGSVPLGVRKQRTAVLRNLSLKKQHYFYTTHLRNSMSVLFENDNKNGFMHGYTGNYIKVKTPFDSTLVNTIATCRLEAIDEDGAVRVALPEMIFA